MPRDHPDTLGLTDGACTLPSEGRDIGAHAAVAGHALLTRDPRRVRTHFPTVPLIAPEADAGG